MSLITKHGLHRVDFSDARNEHGFPVCCSGSCSEGRECIHPFAGEPKTNWRALTGPLVVLLAVIAAVVIVWARSRGWMPN